MTLQESSLLELIAKVASSQVSITLRELFLQFGVHEQLSALEKVAAVHLLCEKYNLEVVPGFGRGDLDTLRRLRFRSVAEFTRESAVREVGKGESQNLEFKSSLVYDRNRAETDPCATAKELKSEAVLHSALRSVAALMNTEGGVLYIGVKDDGQFIGIESDYLFFKPDKRGPDAWELMFRSHINDRFYRGNLVNDLVEVKFIESGNTGCTIARVEVAPRPQLAFLRCAGERQFRLYRRQGNRTTEVPIEEFEDFLTTRRQGTFALP